MNKNPDSLPKDTRNQLLNDLRERILKGGIQKADQEWGGADVAIVQALPERTGEEFYPDPRFIITKFSLELSWLFEEIVKIFTGKLDYMSRYEFYGLLAEAAEKYKIKLNDKDCMGMLIAVLDEVDSIPESFYIQ